MGTVSTISDNRVPAQREALMWIELTTLAERMYGTLVKADVDVFRRILLLDMDMHADGEAFLLEQGSHQEDLWGITLHPEHYGTDGFIEFDSMINIRPRRKNPSRDVLDPMVRAKIEAIVSEVVHA